MKVPFGLHSLNEAVLFVNAVKDTGCKTRIHHDKRIVDGCSLMGVLSLGLFTIAELEVKEGEGDIESFMEAISNLISIA